MIARRRPVTVLLATACAGLAAAALAACSGGSGQRPAPVVPSVPSAPASDGSIPADSSASTSDPSDPAAAMPSGIQSGAGDRHVTAVFQPATTVSDAQLAELTRLVQARAVRIPGTVVTVTADSGAITVIGDTTQLAAIKDLGRKLTVSFRPVAASSAGGITLPAPSVPAEAAAETAYGTAQCSDPTTLPPTAADPYGVACSADAATKYLLGPAGVAGTDVSQTTARGGTAGWEVDLTFTARGGSALAALTSPLAQQSGSVAVVWDATVASAIAVQAPITGGEAQISGLSQEQARQLAAILDLGARGVTLTTSQVTVLQ